MIQHQTNGVPQASAPQQQAAAPFLKGQAAQQAMANEQAKADMRSNGTYRFYVKEGEERMITFLDGNLDANGLLDIPYIHEHRVKINGNFNNIVCTDQTEPCPLCEQAQASNSQDFGYSSFIGFLTVIDHTGYVDNNGVAHQNVVRLYAAKRKTVEMLTKMAQHNGTLAGMCFKVSRSSNKSAAVGDIYIPVGQYKPQDLINHYNAENPERKVGILDYNKEVTYFDAATLRRMLGMGGGLPNAMGAPAHQPVPQQYSHQNGPVMEQPQHMPVQQQFMTQQHEQMPMQPAAPQPAAPQPAAPAKKLVMLCPQFSYEQYMAIDGWTDEKLVQYGKAKWEEAPQQPPAQQAMPDSPNAIAQQNSAVPSQVPFQVQDPNQSDVNTNYQDQL